MSNRLRGSQSLYLLRHADDPVDWYPWGPEAFEAARTSGRPILLSIGYAACHWCHVMAQESFADGATAAVMNDRFVNVKVDRDERPDLDRVYQLTHWLLTRHAGGWPLTAFLTADDRTPFFAGTYFPARARGGQPAFVDLLDRVAAFHREQQPALREQSAALREALAQIDSPPPLAASLTPSLVEELLAKARAELERRFDREHGGFGVAPKFPLPGAVAHLLHHWQRSAATERPDLHALYMATLSLQRMADGGLHDQIGGGFARYSTDAAWEIPHFEKMLSDNAALLELYADAHAATGEPRFAAVAGSTADFLLRDLRAAEGAFIAALGADSAEGEGRFYLWTPAEVRAVAGDVDGALFNTWFGLDGAPNFEGRWLPRLVRPLEELDADARSRLAAVRTRLATHRAQRAAPSRDENVLTGWNALAIRALARASRVLGRADLLEAAIQAMDFVRRTLWRDGRLYTAWRGHAEQTAFLDDHAFLADAALELHSVTADPNHSDFALALVERLRRGFAAPAGGFYFTADDQEAALHRSFRFDDDATPAGNAVAARVLVRLGAMLDRSEFTHAAGDALRAAGAAPLEQPFGHLALIGAATLWADAQR